MDMLAPRSSRPAWTHRPLFLIALAGAVACDGGAGPAKPGTTYDATDADRDGFVADDCSPGDASIHPGATERCNGLDDDCDGAVDEDVQRTFYRDDDADGFGGDAFLACEAASAAQNGNDCDDADPEAWPGNPEVCDTIDNDCDGTIDEGADGGAYWYGDADGDGQGDAGDITGGCEAPAGYVADHGDCDDDDPDVFVGAAEVCDGIDNNCEAGVDEGLLARVYDDDDGDGFGDDTSARDSCEEGGVGVGGDCDDSDPETHPSADERCDGLDNDCDERVDNSPIDAAFWYPDLDADSYGDSGAVTSGCDAPLGYVTVFGDCDDSEPEAFPGNPELCDGIDNDCDGVVDGVVCDVPGCGTSATESLSFADQILPGEASRDEAGAGLAGVGDTDGDGTDDLLIGAPGWTSDAGRAYLVLGGSGAVALSGAPALWNGDSAERAGAAVGGGDLDGDGGIDLVIGAPAASGDAGAVYVVGSRSLGTESLSAASTIWTGGGGDGLGSAITVADLDGDGRASALVGGTTAGGTGGAWLLDSSGGAATGAALILSGEDPDDGAGFALATADFDGDGVLDLIVGAPGRDFDTGVVYVVSGDRLGNVPLSSADARFEGETSLSNTGYSVAAPGDVDGDGQDDLLIGARYVDSFVGAAYLVAGGSASAILSASTAKLVGENAFDYAGTAVAGPGDVDDDGTPDLLIGSPNNAEGGTASGSAYVVTGPVSGTVDLGSAYLKLTGEEALDYAGTTLGAAGDLDGNGIPDVLVGAPSARSGASVSTGIVYGVWSCP